MTGELTWELALFHKAAMTVAALQFPSLPEVAVAGPVDAALVVVLVSSYILTRGWLAWRVREPTRTDA